MLGIVYFEKHICVAIWQPNLLQHTSDCGIVCLRLWIEMCVSHPVPMETNESSHVYECCGLRVQEVLLLYPRTFPEYSSNCCHNAFVLAQLQPSRSFSPQSTN